MNTARKHRFHRNRTAQQNRHSITENDLAILRVLSRYRYLRASFLFPLVGRKASSSGYYSLRKLYDHGYINKPREQHRGYNNLYTPDIYELDKKGADVLNEHIPEATRLVRKKFDGPIKNFGHSMMICDTMASIELGVQQSDCTLITWQEIVERAGGENPMKLPCNIAYRYGTGSMIKKSTFLHPDGLFGIRYPDGKAAFFALESEHFNPIKPSNLDRASFLKKFLGYRDIIKTGAYKQLKIPNMRVLVVAPTKEKVRHMIELVEAEVETSNLFLFQTIPVQEEIFKAPPPFPELFTCEWKRAGVGPARINLT